ncbi:hypothetical protein LIER_15977 [Lithospermum erythrorhizon]|uniref:Uncharacterized protein n=1 Tax=Lithospermum erythrorhizon TaxID=34254 RepID=A0AAV3Q7H7_LITER
MNPVTRQESLATESSSSSLDDSDISSANSPLPQLTVIDKVASKITPDKMSQSSENQIDNFELHPRTVADQAEASISGGMPIIQVEGPLNLVPLPQHAEPANPTPQLNTAEGVRDEAARVEKAYQDGVPCIWILKEEAKGLPIPSAEDIDSVGKLRDEIANIAASVEPQLVDFDDILVDRPSLVTCVAIATKTKPRESMVPEATSTPSTNNVPILVINPLLKRMATAAPSASQPSKKAKKTAPPNKKATQVLARDSLDEESQAHGVQPAAGVVVAPANVVTLDTSTTISDQGLNRQIETDVGHLSLQQELNISFPTPVQQAVLEEKVRLSKSKSIRESSIREGQAEASASVPRLPKYTRMYPAKPYEVPNLEVTSEAPWWAWKFHFHLARPLLSKEMAARYTLLVDPYASFAQSMKHITQAVMLGRMLCLLV